jgi:hypothetical protein
VAICESVSLPQSHALRGCLADLVALAARLDGGPALILVGKVFAAASAIRTQTAAEPLQLEQPVAMPPRATARSVR